MLGAIQVHCITTFNLISGHFLIRFNVVIQYDCKGEKFLSLSLIKEREKKRKIIKKKRRYFSP